MTPTLKVDEGLGSWQGNSWVVEFKYHRDRMSTHVANTGSLTSKMRVLNRRGREEALRVLEEKFYCGALV